MMHTERNWILALLGIAGGAMLMSAFSVATTSTNESQSYANIFAADSPVKEEAVPDIIGEWALTKDGTTTIYVIEKSETEHELDVLRRIEPATLRQSEYQLMWDSNRKAFRGTKKFDAEPFDGTQTMLLTATVENDGMTLRTERRISNQSQHEVREKYKDKADEILKDYTGEVVWTRKPAKELAQAETVATGQHSSMPSIEGRWVMPTMFGARAIILRSRDTNFDYEVSYRPRRKKEDDEARYQLKWDPKIEAFEGTVRDEGIPGKAVVRISTEDNGVTLRVRYLFDDGAKKAFVEAIKNTAFRDEFDQLLDMTWTRETSETPARKSPAEVVYMLGLPIPQTAAPNIAGEWTVSHGNETERYMIVLKKIESEPFHFMVYPILRGAGLGLDRPIVRFQWDSKSNAFVGKILAGVDEKLQIALRVDMKATVEPDGDTMLVTTSIDPEVLGRILKKHGKDSADEASKQCEQETIWTREHVERVADQDAAPAIGGVWLMGDHGRFGKCNIVRSATEGYAFDVYTLKSVLSSNVSQAGPAYRLQWIPERMRFEASAQLSNDPNLPGKVAVSMTREDNGNVLRVVSIPDEAGMKSIESLKQKGINQEAIDQWLDTEWTRETENQQDWTLTEELIGALSQAKPQAGVGGHSLPQSGFGGGGFGGQNNPNPGAGGKNAPSGGGGGNNPNNAPAAGGGAFGRLMDEDPPATPGRGGGFDRMLGEEDDHPFAGGMGSNAKKPQAPVRIDSTEFMLVETNDGLSAYSKSLGKWSALKVGRPKNGTGRLARATTGGNYASVTIDDQLYGYSSQAGEWDRLPVPPEAFAGVKAVPGANVISVQVGDKTYVLSSKTGKWTASDQDPQPPGFSTTTSSAEVENWRQKHSEKVDSQKLIADIADKEAKAVQIAKQIRKIKSENPHASDDSLEIQKLKADLEKNLASTFALKSMLESSRVQELQSRVGRLEQQLIRRQAQRTKIIERHLRELIDGEETDWQTEPANEIDPQTLKKGSGF